MGEVFVLCNLRNLWIAPAETEPAVTVTVDTNSPVNRFRPSEALGAGVDGHELGEVLPQLSPANIAAMRSAGLKPLTYRLRTELAGEAWHWNPKGTWSDACAPSGILDFRQHAGGGQ